MKLRKPLIPFLCAFVSAFALATFSNPAHATSLKVMTFNVMCDFCGTKIENARFQEKLRGVADTINRHSPDLISLQEIWSRGDVVALKETIKTDYISIFANNLAFGYADPTLLIRRSRFKVIESDGLWLGPNAPSFSLGWTTSFPRRLEWVVLEDLQDGTKFVFAGTHFDNQNPNKLPSAELLIEKFKDSKLPVIFAGDTNLRPDYPSYVNLRGFFRDTFSEVKAHAYFSNSATVNSDGCNLAKAGTFPECRVDHVLISKNAPWSVQSWGVDTFRYFKDKTFLSDHRAVIVHLDSTPIFAKRSSVERRPASSAQP